MDVGLRKPAPAEGARLTAGTVAGARDGATADVVTTADTGAVRPHVLPRLREKAQLETKEI